MSSFISFVGSVILVVLVVVGVAYAYQALNEDEDE